MQHLTFSLSLPPRCLRAVSKTIVMSCLPSPPGFFLTRTILQCKPFLAPFFHLPPAAPLPQMLLVFLPLACLPSVLPAVILPLLPPAVSPRPQHLSLTSQPRTQPRHRHHLLWVHKWIQRPRVLNSFPTRRGGCSILIPPLIVPWRRRTSRWVCARGLPGCRSLDRSLPSARTRLSSMPLLLLPPLPRTPGPQGGPGQRRLAVRCTGLAWQRQRGPRPWIQRRPWWDTPTPLHRERRSTSAALPEMEVAVRRRRAIQAGQLHPSRSQRSRQPPPFRPCRRFRWHHCPLPAPQCLLSLWAPRPRRSNGPRAAITKVPPGDISKARVLQGDRPRRLRAHTGMVVGV